MVGYEFPTVSRTYTERDVMLYALAVGAARNPTDPEELKFVYENRQTLLALHPDPLPRTY